MDAIERRLPILQRLATLRQPLGGIVIDGRQIGRDPATNAASPLERLDIVTRRQLEQFLTTPAAADPSVRHITRAQAVDIVGLRRTTHLGISHEIRGWCLGLAALTGIGLAYTWYRNKQPLSLQIVVEKFGEQPSAVIGSLEAAVGRFLAIRLYKEWKSLSDLLRTD